MSNKKKYILVGQSQFINFENIIYYNISII